MWKSIPECIPRLSTREPRGKVEGPCVTRLQGPTSSERDVDNYISPFRFDCCRAQSWLVLQSLSRLAALVEQGPIQALLPHHATRVIAKRGIVWRSWLIRILFSAATHESNSGSGLWAMPTARAKTASTSTRDRTPRRMRSLNRDRSKSGARSCLFGLMP